jgi:hypothetical protein
MHSSAHCRIHRDGCIVKKSFEVALFASSTPWGAVSDKDQGLFRARQVGLAFNHSTSTFRLKKRLHQIGRNARFGSLHYVIQETVYYITPGKQGVGDPRPFYAL